MGDKTPLVRLNSQKVLLMTGKGTKDDTAIDVRIRKHPYGDHDLIMEIKEFLNLREKLSVELKNCAAALTGRIVRKGKDFDLDNIKTEEFVETYETHLKNFVEPGSAVSETLDRIYHVKKMILDPDYQRPSNSGLNDGRPSGSVQPVSLQVTLAPETLRSMGPSTGTTHEVPTSPVSLPDSTSSSRRKAKRMSGNDDGPAKRRPTQCGNCGEVGHNRTSCQKPE